MKEARSEVGINRNLSHSLDLHREREREWGGEREREERKITQIFSRKKVGEKGKENIFSVIIFEIK